MKAKVLFLIVWLGLLLFVSVGCTVGETAVSPTATAVLIVESVDTPTPQPTATSQPTAVPTSTPSPTATNAPTPVPTQMFIMATSISPSGNWIAETESTHVGIEITSTLKVAQANEDTKRIVEVVVGEAMLISEPYPLSWSPDEKYLYVTHRSGVDGCAPGVRSNDVHRGGDVYRFNLETNVLEEITEDGYWHVISPDGTKLAYLSTFRGLVLHDLVTSEEFEIRFELDNSYPYLLKSQLVWSPNNDAVLITASDDPCGLEPKYFLIHVDLDTFEQTTLIDDQKEAVFLILEWTTPEKALVELFDRKIAWVNTTTGELTPFEE